MANSPQKGRDSKTNFLTASAEIVSEHECTDFTINGGQQVNPI